MIKYTPLDRLINVFLYFAYREPGHTIDTQKAFYMMWAADRKQMRYSGSELIISDFEFINGYHLVPTIVEGRLDFVTNLVIANKGSYEAVYDYNPDILSETNRRILSETYEYFHDWNTDKFVKYIKKFPEYIDGNGIIDKKLYFKENRKGFFKDNREAVNLAYKMYMHE